MILLSVAILIATSLSIFVSPAAFNSKRDISQVMSDIAELSADVADADTAITAISSTGSDFVGVATTAMNGLNIAITLTQLTADVQGLGAQVDPADAATIVNEIVASQAQVIQIISVFEAKKSVIEGAFSGAGFFAITNFKTMIKNLITAVQNAAPPESQGAILAFETAISNALTTASAEFPSCSSLIGISL